MPDERSDDKILTSKDVEDVIYKYRNEEFYDLGNIMNGDIQRLIDELQLAENTEKLKEGDIF